MATTTTRKTSPISLHSREKQWGEEEGSRIIRQQPHHGFYRSLLRCRQSGCYKKYFSTTLPLWWGTPHAAPSSPPRIFLHQRQRIVLCSTTAVVLQWVTPIDSLYHHRLVVFAVTHGRCIQRASSRRRRKSGPQHSRLVKAALAALRQSW